MPRPLLIMIILLACAGGAVGAWLSVPSASAVSSQPIGTWDSTDPNLGSKAFVMCQGCHGTDGRGVPGYAPALAGSPWLTGPPLTAILIVLHGYDATSEPHASYVSTRMLGHGNQLSDIEIAALLSWAREQWGNRAARIATSDVTAARTRFATRTTAWSPAELRALIR
jgi:mono/diheme cytochrome c family protein